MSSGLSRLAAYPTDDQLSEQCIVGSFRKQQLFPVRLYVVTEFVTTTYGLASPIVAVCDSDELHAEQCVTVTKNDCGEATRGRAH